MSKPYPSTPFFGRLDLVFQEASKLASHRLSGNAGTSRQLLGKKNLGSLLFLSKAHWGMDPKNCKETGRVCLVNLDVLTGKDERKTTCAIHLPKRFQKTSSYSTCSFHQFKGKTNTSKPQKNQLNQQQPNFWIPRFQSLGFTSKWFGKRGKRTGSLGSWSYSLLTLDSVAH